MELHQNVDKFLHLREKVVENSRLAPQFLPSQRPNLPAITISIVQYRSLSLYCIIYCAIECTTVSPLCINSLFRSLLLQSLVSRYTE